MLGGAGHSILEPGLAEDRASGEGLGWAEEVQTWREPRGVCFLCLGAQHLTVGRCPPGPSGFMG